MDYWAEQTSDATVVELERIGQRLGLSLHISQLEGGHARVQVRARHSGSTALVALASDKHLGLVWNERDGATGVSVCPGSAKMVLQGQERDESTVFIYSETEGRTGMAHLLPSTSREPLDWTYWISTPRKSLGDVLPGDFQTSRWSLFQIDPVISLSFVSWTDQFLGSTLNSAEGDERQLRSWVKTLSHPLRLEDTDVYQSSHYADLVGAAVSRTGELDQPTSVAELAAKIGVSTRTLQRAFRSGLGVSTKRYLRSQQLRLAHEMLKAGSHSVAYVTHAIGFGHQSRFSKEYFEFYGEYPSAAAVQNQESALTPGFSSLRRGSLSLTPGLSGKKSACADVGPRTEP